MVKIKVRTDEWINRGSDEIYEAKQTMKKSLEEIGEKEDLDELEAALSEIPETDSYFIGHPYLIGPNVMCKINEGLGEACLGSVTGFVN